MYEELIKKLRYESTWCQMFPEQAKVLVEAADAIEQLEKKLCDWCGVCPEEKRRPNDCEIMFPDMPVPEVWIEPPKEEQT